LRTEDFIAADFGFVSIRKWFVPDDDLETMHPTQIGFLAAISNKQREYA
jgi:hypothetical protein